MLTVDFFQAHYLVSREHPSPEKLRARLDDIVQQRLPAALDNLLEEWERQNPGLWFIRDLDIELDINAAWDDDLVADLWAEKILHRLVQSSPEEEPGWLFFADQAAYLARFLVDLAAGRAWGIWYYQSYEGLRSLPTAAALRTALEEDPELGLTALVRLEQNELESVLAAMSEADARRLLARYATGLGVESASSASQELIERCWRAWESPGRSFVEAGEVLFHLVQAVRGGSHPQAVAQLIYVTRALTRLSRLIDRLDEQQAGRLLSALSGGDLATLCTITNRVDGEALRPLLAADPEWIWQAGRALRRGGVLTSSSVESPEGELAAGVSVRYTSFGGAFLLLPFLEALPLDRIASDWPGLGDFPAGTLVRFLILAASLGGERSEQVFMDPLLRDIFCVPPVLLKGEVAAWGKSLPEGRWKEVSRLLMGWQIESGLAEAPIPVVVSLEKPGRVIVLEISRNLWRCVADRRSLRQHFRAGEVLYYDDEETGSLLRAWFPGLQTASLNEAQFSQGSASLEEIRTRLARVREDWEYLQLPTHLTGSKGFSSAIALAAQNVLRLFAGRLPGFSLSGPSYLVRNFLDFSAAFEEQPDRCVVRLGRPPLALVLGMAGQNRQSYRLDWLDGRLFELYQQDSLA